jgi:hypothetical protein
MMDTRCLASLLAASLLVTACGDDGGNGSDIGGADGGNGPNDPVERTLSELGVSSTSEPRVDDDGDPLPDDYAPLGSRRTINRFAEIVPFGLRLEGDLTTDGRMPVLDIEPGANNTFSWSVLRDDAPADTPWFTDAPGRARAAANGDFDRDGQDEIAIVYQIDGEPVRLVIMDGAPDYGFSEPVVVDTGTWDQLFVAAGDFDGNETEDLVIALVSNAEGTTLVTFANDGEFRLDGTPRRIERLGEESRETQVVLQAGNIDYDRALELAVVVNQYRGEVSNGAGGSDISDSSRYVIYDDSRNGHAVLKSDLAVIDVGTEVKTAKVADIALGDVDGDNVDEVVLGGLDVVGNATNPPNYLVEVFDDAKRDFAHLDGRETDSRAISLQPQASGAMQYLVYLHVLTADLDGDGAAEVVTNQFVYEDLRQAGGALVRMDLGEGPLEIPMEDLFAEGNSGDDYYFSWASSDMEAADVTSDRRDNIVLYAQTLNFVIGEGQTVQVWGIDGIDGWKKMLDVFTQRSNPLNRGEQLHPQLLLADAEVDNESMALEYSDGSYRFVFTEPVVLAALAAAPCSENLGQSLGSSCRTAFGRAISDTQAREDSWTIIAGVSVGFDATVPFVGGPEAIVDTRNTIRNYSIDSYTLTTSVLRETGALEDSVIFTTVPLDIYTYTVLSHPNPDLIGEQLEVRLPREPITVMVEREIYNAAVGTEGPQIDDSVFTHVEGDPASYPTRAEKDALLRQNDGLESEEVDVGQGTGQTVVSISDFSSTTSGQSYDFETTLNLKATAGGVVGGFTVGGGAGFALEITRGEETIYQGSVGNISEEFFPAEAYSWGLFSYIHEDAASGQTFEVLNYWVEP